MPQGATTKRATCPRTPNKHGWKKRTQAESAATRATKISNQFTGESPTYRVYRCIACIQFHLTTKET